MTAQIWYTGRKDELTISAEKFAQMGEAHDDVTWNAGNGWSVDDDFGSEVRSWLTSRGDFAPAPTSDNPKVADNASSAQAVTYHYTASGAPFGDAGEVQIPLTGVDGAPTADVDAEGSGAVASASLPAGAYLCTYRTGGGGGDMTGFYAYIDPSDTTAVPFSVDQSDVFTGKVTGSFVLDAPGVIYAAAGADNAQEGRTIDFDVWFTKVADFAT